MTNSERHAQDSLEIFIGELMADEELLRSFLREPEQTLALADEWGLPLTKSELQSLQRPAFRLWDRVTEELEARYSEAA
jgi:hypothetical protein